MKIVCLKDVNFTTATVTNKLPAALTALITSETTKIKEMIEAQNIAVIGQYLFDISYTILIFLSTYGITCLINECTWW